MGVVTETGVETILVASVIDAGLFSSTLVHAGLGLIFNIPVGVGVVSQTPVGAGVLSKTPIDAWVISNAGVAGRVAVDVDGAAIAGGSTGMNQLGAGGDEGSGSEPAWTWL